MSTLHANHFATDPEENKKPLPSRNLFLVKGDMPSINSNKSYAESPYKRQQ